MYVWTFLWYRGLLTVVRIFPGLFYLLSPVVMATILLVIYHNLVLTQLNTLYVILTVIT